MGGKKSWLYIDKMKQPNTLSSLLMVKIHGAIVWCSMKCGISIALDGTEDDAEFEES